MEQCGTYLERKWGRNFKKWIISHRINHRKKSFRTLPKKSSGDDLAEEERVQKKVRAQLASLGRKKMQHFGAFFPRSFWLNKFRFMVEMSRRFSDTQTQDMVPIQKTTKIVLNWKGVNFNRPLPMKTKPPLGCVTASQLASYLMEKGGWITPQECFWHRGN